mmetsp:Transcript_45369/g.95203  ORF Transcript_45369/g.95203 Transcript_45369/m.95203 type:complete len:386 (-) Transcript_45369:416-1573(-)
MAEDDDGTATSTNSSESSYWTFHEWTFSDFTPWAFVSAFLWVPGGTAGVYAIRRAGIAVSVGIWSCVIILLSFVWGVLIFGEKQKSAWGAACSMAVLCAGLCGISYFSSAEKESTKQSNRQKHQKKETGDEYNVVAGETTPLMARADDGNNDEASLDFEAFPHSGISPHSHQMITIRTPALPILCTEPIVFRVQKYHVGLLMAAINGALAATIMVPLHYAPPNTTRGVGYQMSFGIASVVAVMVFWLLRLFFHALEHLTRHSRWSEFGDNNGSGRRFELRVLMQILTDSMSRGYRELPSFHIRQMWKSGLTAGLLYSSGNLFGIVSIQKLGDFMGYSLNQSSIIISGLWGIFYYREIPGAMNMIGFFTSSCVVFAGVLLLANEHQ